jgi:hypothetical protein
VAPSRHRTRAPSSGPALESLEPRESPGALLAAELDSPFPALARRTPTLPAVTRAAFSLPPSLDAAPVPGATAPHAEGSPVPFPALPRSGADGVTSATPIVSPGGGAGTRSVPLFYGGDWDGRNALANGINTSSGDARVYDDVRWRSSWSVTELYSDNLMDTGPISRANWEVRKGVSRGDAGTVVAGGQNVAATQTVINCGFGWCWYQVKVEVPALTLPAGHYWINVQPVGNGSGASYQLTTVGANGVGGPLANGQAYFDSPYFGYHFAPVGSILGTGTWDFSGGINGP